MEEFTNVINLFIWEKKKEIARKYSSIEKEEEKRNRGEEAGGREEERRGGLEEGLPCVLRSLRQQMATESAND
jgi:hypothetical protein